MSNSLHTLKIKEHASIAGGTANLNIHFGKHYGGFSVIWALMYLKTQQYQPGYLLKSCTIMHRDISSTMFIVARNMKKN